MHRFPLFETDERFSPRAVDILAALNSLHYLICEDAEDPVKVRHYAGIMQERLQALHELGERALVKIPSYPAGTVWSVQ